MHFSVAFVVAALITSSLAAPIYRMQGFSGLLEEIAQKIKNPAQKAVIQVEAVNGLQEMQTTLQNLAKAAHQSGNAGVAPFVQDAITNLTSAQIGVNNIISTLNAGAKAKIEDGTNVAQSIVKAQIAIGKMPTAITSFDAMLDSDIQTIQANITQVVELGKEILQNRNLNFTDVGLNADGTGLLD
jgi:hypothetical protein